MPMYRETIQLLGGSPFILDDETHDHLCMIGTEAILGTGGPVIRVTEYGHAGVCGVAKFLGGEVKHGGLVMIDAIMVGNPGCDISAKIPMPLSPGERIFFTCDTSAPGKVCLRVMVR